ncbi:MAG TPA: hypothetical protein VG276_15480 [Actinomycetes bacterium]|jgi:hypothetical protein|nr:hypothetical protein [Actinomycetes bacterium]
MSREWTAAAGHRPLADTARGRLVGDGVSADVVTRLGARLAIADPAERSAGSPGGARG